MVKFILVFEKWTCWLPLAGYVRQGNPLDWAQIHTIISWWGWLNQFPKLCCQPNFQNMSASVICLHRVATTCRLAKIALRSEQGLSKELFHHAIFPHYFECWVSPFDSQKMVVYLTPRPSKFKHVRLHCSPCKGRNWRPAGDLPCSLPGQWLEKRSNVFKTLEPPPSLNLLHNI